MSLFPAAQQYKPPTALLCKAPALEGKQLTSGLELIPEMSSHVLPPPSSSHSTHRDNWYQQHLTPLSCITTAGKTNLPALKATQIVGLLWPGASQLGYGGSCSNKLVPWSDFSSISQPRPCGNGHCLGRAFPSSCGQSQR